MVTEETRQKLVDGMRQKEEEIARQRQAELDSKPVILNQNQADVNLFIKTVQENNGIVEYNLKNILYTKGITSERRYLRARKDAISFCMGSITMDRKTRRFYNHRPELSQEKLL